MAAAQELNCDVTEVDVQDIEAKADGDIHAHVRQVGRIFNRATLDLGGHHGWDCSLLCRVFTYSIQFAIVIRGVKP
jgi:hypothetical protein